MILSRLQCPRIPDVVQDLNLNALIGRTFVNQRTTDGDSVICTFSYTKLESETKVAVFFVREKESAAICWTNERSPFDRIALAVGSAQLPPIQTSAIKQRDVVVFVIKGPPMAECG